MLSVVFYTTRSVQSRPSNRRYRPRYWMLLNVVLRRCLLLSSGSCDHRRSFSGCESPWIRHSASVRHFSLFITSSSSSLSSSSSSSSSLLLLLLLSIDTSVISWNVCLDQWFKSSSSSSTNWLTWHTVQVQGQLYVGGL